MNGYVFFILLIIGLALFGYDVNNNNFNYYFNDERVKNEIVLEVKQLNKDEDIQKIMIKRKLKEYEELKKDVLFKMQKNDKNTVLDILSESVNFIGTKDYHILKLVFDAKFEKFNNEVK